MNITAVNTDIVKNKAKKRVGRGNGSGWGKTSGRGSNGQGARAGFSMSPAFEGGQMPFSRRVPKRGFNNKRFADKVQSITLATIVKNFDGSEVITPDLLKAKRIMEDKSDFVKIIGNDELTAAYNFQIHFVSKGAKDSIEKAGGKIEILPGKKPVVKNKMKSKNSK